MDSFSRSIEITILSAENLRLDGKLVKSDAFVVVKMDPLNSKSTRADHEGGCNPVWNQKLEMEMASNCRFITLQIECRIGSGNRAIGTAAIPVSDFVGGYFPDNYLHLLSYRLRDVRGEKNGIINVSVKVKGLADYVLPPVRKNSRAGYTTTSYSCSESTWGMPVKGINNHDGGVVTGVPLWCAART